MKHKVPDYGVDDKWKKTLQDGKKCSYAVDGTPQKEATEDTKNTDTTVDLKTRIHNLRDSKAASFKGKLTDE